MLVAAVTAVFACNPTAYMRSVTDGLEIWVSAVVPALFPFFVFSKLLTDLPAVDIVVTMGCNVQCPALPCRHREDWGLDDPTWQSDAVFLETIEQIREKILDLRRRVMEGKLG